MDTDADSEAELWARSLSGDSAAFGELFDQHRDRVFRHAFHLMGNVHDAEDAAASVFLELWRRRKHVRVVNGSIAPWLLVTATNTCRNLKRAAHRYRHFMGALPRDPDSPAAEEELLRQHPLDSIDESLLTALTKLSRTDMQLFSLVNLEDYSISEAATVLGLSATAAKTRLHRARVRLRAALGEPYGLPSTLVTEPEGDPS